MSDFPGGGVTQNVITSYSDRCFAAAELRAVNGMAQPASATYPAANLAIFIPMFLEVPFRAQGGLWVNGSSVTGTADSGIYTLTGTRVVSTGATTRSGASSVDGTDFPSEVLIPPGAYYLAFSASSGAANTAFLNTSVTSAIGKPAGLLQMASAHPLPATATFAAWSSTGYPICGVYGA